MKKHPILKLTCNADGSIIRHNGKKLHISTTTRNGKPQSGTVSVKGHKVSVVRIICECYYGMRDDKTLFPVRKDGNVLNNHYSNLYWGKRRGKLKIVPADLPKMHALIDKDVSVQDLATQYGVTEQTIRIYKRKYLKSKL